MAEKVIHEVRVVETETGYRIEINGDKERIKQMFGKRMGFGGPGGFAGPWGHHGFGPGGHHGPWGRHFGRHFARHFARHGWGPWGWDEEAEDESEPQRGPAADKGPDGPRV